MPPVLRICAVAALLLTLAEAASAEDKFSSAWTADAVVVGELKLSSYFLSFDGVHVNGSIQATEVLYGTGYSGSQFAFHLLEPCSLWVHCDYRALWHNWSENKKILLNGRIWALDKGSASSWTVWPYGHFVYSLSDREGVIAALERRKLFFAKP